MSRQRSLFTGFGEAGTAAEAVAERPAKEALRYLAANVPVGSCLADQLMPIMALGAGGSFRTLALSRHARTNIEVIRQFLDVHIDTIDEGRERIVVNIEPGKGGEP